MTLQAQILIPNLMVNNVTDTVNFYVNQLGFTLAMSVDESKTSFDKQLDNKRAYIWAQLVCGSVEIMIQRRDSFEEDIAALKNTPIGSSTTLYIKVEQLEVLYQQYCGKQLDIVKPLATTWYGMKEFYIKDNSGYILCFAEMDDSVQTPSE